MLSNAGSRKFDSGATGAGGRIALATIPAPARIASAALALLQRSLPQACALCRADSGDTLLCDACRSQLPRIPAACPRCALPSVGALVCAIYLGLVQTLIIGGLFYVAALAVTVRVRFQPEGLPEPGVTRVVLAK